jgi:asparagine synthase (glutamine-hydrolysing)
MEDLLSHHNLERRGWLRPEAVHPLMAEHLAGRRDHSLFLWALMVLELWARAHLDGEPS